MIKIHVADNLVTWKHIPDTHASFTFHSINTWNHNLWNMQRQFCRNFMSSTHIKYWSQFPSLYKQNHIHVPVSLIDSLSRLIQYIPRNMHTVFCFAVLCCGYTLTDFPISIRLTSLALWQSNDCPSASKATLMNMDKYFMWIHYERLHNHNKAKHNKTVCIFLRIYCIILARIM